MSAVRDPLKGLTRGAVVARARHDLRPGTHINGVGSFRAEMRELDAETVRLSTVFVDHLPAAQAGAGELIQAVAEGAWDWAHLAGTLGQLVTGAVAGRTDEDEITLFKSVGLAVQDAVCARRVYDVALAQGLGQNVEISEARNRL